MDPGVSVLRRKLSLLREDLVVVDRWRPHPVDVLGEDGEPHHLYENQRLFPPPTPAEEITGRVKYIKREDRVCHPTPFERPQQCRALPIVLARVTINLDESLDNQ